MMRDFWRSSGWHLLDGKNGNRLVPGPSFLRLYARRPELEPDTDACDNERSLHARFIDDPMVVITPVEIDALADEDARHNWRVVIAFRDLLVERGSLEAAYLAIARGQAARQVPPLFVDQLVHAILRDVLAGVDEAMRLRAAEIFFREQSVSTENGRIMLADTDTIEMYSAAAYPGGIGQLLSDSGTPARTIELDVLDDDNAEVYWDRSDRFDTVVDFRFTQPALDAFARVMEAWVFRFLDLQVKIQPMQRIDDEHWAWHIGLDPTASRILNALYKGEELEDGDSERIVALFRLEIVDQNAVISTLGGRPVYLGLASSPQGRLKMKPQNLLVNLPLERDR